MPSPPPANKLLAVLRSYYIGELVTCVDATIDQLALRFSDDRYISIYNPWTISPHGKSLEDTQSQRLLDVGLTDHLNLIFDYMTIAVDLQARAFAGPEAFQIRGPGDIVIIWQAGADNCKPWTAR